MSHKLYFDGSKKDKFITYGCVLYHEDKILTTINGQIKSRYINSHMAEYVALIMGLLLCISLNIKSIDTYGDAKNVIEQMENSKIPNPQNIYPFYIVARLLSHHFDYISFTWIGRDNNGEADSLTRISYDK